MIMFSKKLSHFIIYVLISYSVILSIVISGFNISLCIKKEESLHSSIFFSILYSFYSIYKLISVFTFSKKFFFLYSILIVDSCYSLMTFIKGVIFAELTSTFNLLIYYIISMFSFQLFLFQIFTVWFILKFKYCIIPISIEEINKRNEEIDRVKKNEIQEKL